MTGLALGRLSYMTGLALGRLSYMTGLALGRLKLYDWSSPREAQAI